MMIVQMPNWTHRPERGAEGHRGDDARQRDRQQHQQAHGVPPEEPVALDGERGERAQHQRDRRGAQRRPDAKARGRRDAALLERALEPLEAEPGIGHAWSVVVVERVDADDHERQVDERQHRELRPQDDARAARLGHQSASNAPSAARDQHVQQHHHDRDGGQRGRQRQVAGDATSPLHDVAQELRAGHEGGRDVVTQGQREREDGPCDDGGKASGSTTLRKVMPAWPPRRWRPPERSRGPFQACEDGQDHVRQPEVGEDEPDRHVAIPGRAGRTAPAASSGRPGCWRRRQAKTLTR